MVFSLFLPPPLTLFSPPLLPPPPCFLCFPSSVVISVKMVTGREENGHNVYGELKSKRMIKEKSKPCFFWEGGGGCVIGEVQDVED